MAYRNVILEKKVNKIPVKISVKIFNLRDVQLSALNFYVYAALMRLRIYGHNQFTEVEILT